MEKLVWSKRISGSKLEIRHTGEVIGSISWDSLLSSRAQAMINGKLFILNREFFLSKLEIYDANDRSLLGTVMINLFNPRNDVVINGKRFELEVQNFWQSRWAWKFSNTEIISYNSDEFLFKNRGEIELSTKVCDEVEILILLGLFVRNQFILLLLIVLIIIVLILL